MPKYLFDNWHTLLITFVVGVLAYVALIFMLRISGKRTLSKMNAFDLVVTVALGSTLATILLNRDVSLAEGILALGLLVFMQFAVTWTSVRNQWVRRLVTGEPTIIFYRGEILPAALRRVRVTEDEVYAAVRAAGKGDLSEVGAVILETDGSFTVVNSPAEPAETSSLRGLMADGDS